jgi:hypothetical protein
LSTRLDHFSEVLDGKLLNFDKLYRFLPFLNPTV